MSSGQVSSFCHLGNCVKVSTSDSRVYVGSTQQNWVLSFTTDEWTAFLAGVLNGEFSLERLRGDES